MEHSDLDTLLHIRAASNDLKFNSGRSRKSRATRARERRIAAPPGDRGDGGRSGIGIVLEKEDEG